MIPITSPPMIVKSYAEKFTSFFSKPQFAHFLTYLNGLIVSTNKTVQGINNNFLDRKDQSTLNHFITDADWDEETVNNRRIELINEHMKNVREKDTSLIVDDTLSHKTGAQIDQVELFYDHSLYRHVLAHQLVTSVLVARDKHFPIGLRLYKKYKENDHTFKTKIQLAAELI